MSSVTPSQTVMGSGSKVATQVVEQDNAIKKIPDALVLFASSSPNRRSKRRRFDPIPTFARPCRNLKSGRINKNRSPVKKAANPIARNPGLLGPWEDSITKATPSAECIRHLSDFLYQKVVGTLDADTGAVIEIEAKIGQLIDKKTNARIAMPFTTEHVLNKHDPQLQTYFKSSMTENQHSNMNKFLNKVFQDSQNSQKRPFTDENQPRVPINYRHTRECDSFYELSASGLNNLPLAIRNSLNSRRQNAKVRITTDQQTGATLAQIVKVRLADLDVYSPNTEFDYRVSINLEANLTGNWRDFVIPTALSVKGSERRKDRMSYKHLAYQIDLTQVKSPDAPAMHELEVEVSTAELCKHAILMRDSQPNEFEKLVQGFANNIRILARGPKYRLPWW